jgi:hypothetical protein
MLGFLLALFGAVFPALEKACDRLVEQLSNHNAKVA